MILYYTGTGNSRHLARILAEKLGDELVSAAELIREGRTGDFRSEKPWVFVCPTYGWQIPHIFRDFIREASFSGSREAWFVMNCGSEIGNGAQGIQTLCDEKNLIAEMMKHYADGSDANQNVLPEQIKALCGRMDSVVAECLAECVQENRTQSFVQKDLTNRVSDLEGKVLFAYIALIVAAVSLVLGIAALVIGLNKSRVKALEQKTREIQQKAGETGQKFRDDALQLNKRIEQLSLDMVKPGAAEREIAELKRIMERMRKEQESHANNSNIANKPGEAVVDNTPKPVGYLHLNYNSVAPQMSLFEQKESGKYVLYSDETIAPAALPQTNTARGWESSGLCYLFDLENNNRVVQPAELGDSYYEILEVVERAKVEDRKKLAQKGILRIQKRSC